MAVRLAAPEARPLKLTAAIRVGCSVTSMTTGAVVLSLLVSPFSLPLHSKRQVADCREDAVTWHRSPFLGWCTHPPAAAAAHSFQTPPPDIFFLLNSRSLRCYTPHTHTADPLKIELKKNKNRKKSIFLSFFNSNTILKIDGKFMIKS